MASRIVVVGGGIAGLAATHRLLRLRATGRIDDEVELLEASGRLGGKIRTERIDGAVVEAGPDSFLTAKPEAVALARELGLGERLLPTARERRDVYVYARGRLRRFPEGLLLMAPSRLWPFLVSDIVTWRGKLRIGLEPFMPRGGGEDESLAAFARRRLGREALETIVDPMMAGIFAADAERLSLRSTFPQFAEMEARGGLLRGLRAARRSSPREPELTPFASFPGGLQDLVEALARELGPTARTGVPVRRVARSAGGLAIETDGGRIEARAAILAVPASVAADALEGADAVLAGLLREIPAASSATVALGFERAALPRVPAGFGFVVPRAAGRTITAATFVSQKFPGRDAGPFLIRCFVGGAGAEAAAARSDAELRDRALADLREIIGLDAAPRFSRVFRWPGANPQYNVGHEARLRRIEERTRTMPGLLLAGAFYHGVGIPDCIRSGFSAAEKLANR